MRVAFRSAKERYFRRAKGDYKTIVSRTLLTSRERLPIQGNDYGHY